jgi:hypothetical protein
MGKIQVLMHAVLRAAAWPIETVLELRSPDLAKAASAVFDAERHVLTRRQATTMALHAAIPQFEGPTRAYLLNLKRQVYNQMAELPQPTPSVFVQLVTSGAVTRLISEEMVARKALAERTLEFERIYSAEFERERCALRARTADLRFLKALVIANPRVAAGWMSTLRLVTAGGRKQRRLERTVFRYLLRAVGRPTPHGAWSGVSLVSPRSTTASQSLFDVTPMPARYEATVNLLPFAIMLKYLARQNRYRQVIKLQINPTLYQVQEGWRYQRNDNSEWCLLPRERLFVAILDYFEDGRSHPIAPVLDALERASSADAQLREAFRRVIDGLIDQDVLRVNLRLPSEGASVWEVLDAIIPRLLEPDRLRWFSAVCRIRALCDELSHTFETCELTELETLRRAIAKELEGLWRATGLLGRSPGPTIRLDMRLPFEIEWSTGTQEAAQRAIRALLAFHAADGSAELFRRQNICDFARALKGRSQAHLLPLLANLHVNPTDSQNPLEENEGGAKASSVACELLFRGLPAGGAEAHLATKRSVTWHSVSEDVHDRRVYTLPLSDSKSSSLTGPWGSILLRFMSDGAVWIGPGRPELRPFLARHVNLLRNTRGDGQPAFLREIDELLAIPGRNGVDLAEVVGWNPSNLNASIHPSLDLHVLDPHGCRGKNLQDLRLCMEPVNLRPWFLRSHSSRPVVPVLTCAADLGARDGVTSALTRLASAHGWEFLGFGFPPPCAELLRRPHLPRLLLNDGIVLSAERWTLDRPTASQLRKHSGSARYLAWRREAERLNLPDVVLTRSNLDEPELLMFTDSPLAVEYFLDEHASGDSSLSLVELPGDPASWPLRDSQGGHYMAEVAVSWSAEDYWQELGKQIGALR